MRRSFWFHSAAAAVLTCMAVPSCGGEGDPSLDGAVLDGDAHVFDGGFDAGVDAAQMVDTCGNGVVEPGEECDDENSVETDACNSSCEVTNPADGAPIEADDDVWTYVAIEGSVCRDGSPTGIMINASASSNDVMIFFEGGGACFNGISCLANPRDFDPDGFSKSDGIFDRDDPENPIRDWNYVYFPFCTGDVHAGDAANKIPDGPSWGPTQEFRGYSNVTRALERIVPTFASANQVLLTGVSAGGFGAAANFEQVQRAFQDIPVTLLDDSGPPMSSMQIAPCLQDAWRTLWGFDDTFLEECGDDCPDSSDYVLDVVAHVFKRYPSTHGALVSHTEDGTIRTFYGFGSNDCESAMTLPPELYTAGLIDVREYVHGLSSSFGSYYIDGTVHTCIANDCFYDTVIDDVPLSAFVGDLVAGGTSDVGPPAP